MASPSNVPRTDYGLDLTLFTYNPHGEIENGVVYLQLKATDRLEMRDHGNTIAVRLQQRDLQHWLHEPQPVMLVLYDAKHDRALWLYLQAHFEALPGFRLSRIRKSTTVKVDVNNVLDEAAIRKFAAYRDPIARQQKGKVMHHV